MHYCHNQQDDGRANIGLPSGPHTFPFCKVLSVSCSICSLTQWTSDSGNAHQRSPIQQESIAGLTCRTLDTKLVVQGRPSWLVSVTASCTLSRLSSHLVLPNKPFTSLSLLDSSLPYQHGYDMCCGAHLQKAGHRAGCLREACANDCLLYTLAGCLRI